MYLYRRRYLELKEEKTKLKFRCKKCSAHHLMRCNTLDKESRERIACQRCSNLLVNHCLVFWTCKKCDIIICGKCIGYDKVRCPYGHPLKNADHYSGEKLCDVCLDRKFTEGLSCSCDFDICKRCIRGPKRVR